LCQRLILLLASVTLLPPLAPVTAQQVPAEAPPLVPNLRRQPAPALAAEADADADGEEEAGGVTFPTDRRRERQLDQARRLIAESGIPLAAPSANRSEAVSPTTAHHVLESLGNRIDLILDGGPCTKGIESTVIDCTASPPRILRPGPLSRAELEAVVGGAVGWPEPAAAHGPARSPGQQARHYAPKTPLEMAPDASRRVAALVGEARRIGWLTSRTDDPEVRRLAAASRDLVIVPMPADAEGFAARLYATLHALDQRQLDRIVVDEPPDTEAWRAVRDRLSRAIS